MDAEKLVYDVGMADAKDTEYYLSLGYRVVALDANPAAVEEASQRLRRFLDAGQLTILNHGISDQGGKQVFWVNEANPHWSSFDRENAAANDPRVHAVEIECVNFGSVLEKYGQACYIKIDIEGADSACINALRPETAPEYLSVEIFGGDYDGVLERLRKLGYRRFKLINQDTHTQNVEIFHDDLLVRGFRKLITVAGLMGAVRNLPAGWKPGRIEFEPTSTRVSDSGPFGERTHGGWRTFDEIQRRVRWVIGEHPERRYWYDLHCGK